ncbi:GTPase [candidate division KSB1 bacterium]|nr:GTPase [bacterium]OQX59638.1 MAG: GTPase [candidate division KSB1 bacterium 4484_219]RKY76591.1 MAG: GTPase [candidate division KSB1 bacterium]
MQRQKVVIMGAAGRDFHNFNVFFRDNPAYQVVAFTATQIPNIESRRYPSELAGNNYPDGIPIYPEEDLSKLISEHEIDTVVFAYSDVSHEYVMHKAAEAMATGADFMVMGTRHTMLQSKKPVVAVCAVRTGCGKSQTTRRVSKILREYGKKVVVVRHPMPYGYLKAQRVQRFATLADLDRHDCTIEEREEYEPHIVEGNTVYAGVEYSEILAQAEQEADIILWDGGNNDMPFFKPNLLITVVDPHRPGHETRYFPGETNLRMADIVVINKEDTASRENIEAVRAAVLAANPAAAVVDAASPISAENPELIKNKRVLVVEDGPTLTHGEMAYGAGVVAARKFGAAELVDPRPYLVGSILETFRKYPNIGTLLPAIGYGEKQIRDLEETINRTECDSVIVATPIDLRRVVKLNKPATRVKYELQEIGDPTLSSLIEGFISKVCT